MTMQAAHAMLDCPCLQLAQLLMMERWGVNKCGGCSTS
eukprot:CAMPEP_0202877546 /NCGR_PEP_ID=MMETSP1391-20130828/30839_1 /ASSEMBLY_ACC=CAM_ASM_000867 /TAXON_ID=1034604 /ORGANISM="Chlamydomonas leiostraca, Strain SAG 11-49" /LENGTH=37 /DNA_ID= /DNA_START= /DNA_END= /DNA_ORIENTATION=